MSLFVDWLTREGGALFSWWLLIMLAAAAIFPLGFRLMRGLPSRGYALMPAAGLMLIGFVFWILNCLGFMQNTPGATVLSGLIVLGIGVISYVTWPEREPLLPWLRRNLTLILTVEILFTVMFVVWASFRALHPDLTGTEKPMEMAFLSAIRRSASFPPNDPWMSGYAISYYHYGYILMGMLANLSGVSNGTAFNLAVSLLFALTGVGVFGVVYDLVAAHVQFRSKLKNEDLPRLQVVPQGLAVGVLAAIFAVVMGNLGTMMVEIPYESCTASPAYLQFMDVTNRQAYPASGATPTSPCGTPNSVEPATWNFWWWFTHSRIITDYDFGGERLDVAPITEFPNFSFILSDMHPHVLALPFAALAIGLALNLVLRRRDLEPWELLIYAIFVGGMVFLNTWDIVYLGLVVGAEALRRLIRNGTGWLESSDWWGIARFGLTMLVLTGILYAPFFVSFRSQASGILPNVIWPTEFQQFFLMFGVFIVILGVYLVVEVSRAGRTFNAAFARSVLLGVVGFIVLAFVILALTAAVKPDIRRAVFQAVDLPDDPGAVVLALIALIPRILERRLLGVITEGVLLLAIFVVIGRLFAREPRTAEGTPAETRQVITYSPASGFVLLVIAAGAVLTLAPDFVYLRDVFGVRINTIFKLWYQGWMLWSIASAFALWSVLADPVWKPAPIRLRAAFGVVVTALILGGLLYPINAVISRYWVEAGRNRAPINNQDGGTATEFPQEAMTLEGGPSLALGDDDYKTIQCLMQVATDQNDVVAEGAFLASAYHNEYGRVSALSGIPTVIGWENHEQQWRGDTFAAAVNVTFSDGSQHGRTAAVGDLYNTTDWSQAQQIIKEFGITYIYVGPTERRLYTQDGLAKFDGLTPVCRNGDVAAYSTDSIGQQVPTATGS
jgi:YYY domain-containing protein